MTALLTADSRAPEFTLPDQDDRAVSLSGFAGRSVILYFYPAALSPGCTIEAVDFSSALPVLHEAGYEVLGCSPDDVATIAQFRNRSALGLTLLADVEKQVVNLYGAYGVRMLYGKPFEGVVRSTFVIDVDAEGVGKIRIAQYNVKVTGHVAKIMRELGV